VIKRSITVAHGECGGLVIGVCAGHETFALYDICPHELASSLAYEILPLIEGRNTLPALQPLYPFLHAYSASLGVSVLRKSPLEKWKASDRRSMWPALGFYDFHMSLLARAILGWSRLPSTEDEHLSWWRDWQL
jgi:hypothetical protein